MGTSKKIVIAATSSILLFGAAGCGRYVDNNASAGDTAPSLSLPPAPASVAAAPSSNQAGGVTLPDEPLDPTAVGVQVTSANTVVSPPTVASTVPPRSLPSQATSQTTVPQAPSTKPSTKAVAPTKSIDYTVKSGDTLSVIAQNNGIRLSSLAAFNGISDRDTLKPGQVIKIPQ